MQGCPIRCEGCGVPWTWDPARGNEVDIEDLFEEIVSSKEKNGIEGVTFLGGEPFEQAEALAVLAKKVHEAGLSVMTFSGYYLEHLQRSKREAWHELLAETDLLIDGPFIKRQLDLSQPWKGSSNQRYHFLTNRYSHLKEELQGIPNKIEIRLERDGTISLNGMATQDTLDHLFENLAIRNSDKKG